MKTNPPTGQFSRRKVLGAVALVAGAAVVAPLLGAAPAGAQTLTGLTTAGGTPSPSDVTPQDVPVYLDTTATLDERVEAILTLMTSDQKLACLNGLPATVLADGYHLGAQGSNGVEGLHGSGEVANATMFPQAIGLGSTWDTDLIEQVGHVVGFEVRSRSTSSLPAWGPASTASSCASPPRRRVGRT